LTVRNPVQTTDIVANEKIIITHPFLSNYKKQYVLKASVKRGPKPFLLCEDGNGNEALLPVEYTNLGKPRLSDEQQEVAPYFIYNDLIELRIIIENIKQM